MLEASHVREDRSPVGTRLSLIAVFLLFRVALDLGYVWFVAPEFRHLGFGLSVDAFRLLESFILTLMLAGICPVVLKRPSEFLVVVLSCAIALPMLSLYAWGGGARVYLYMVLSAFLILRSVTLLPRLRMPVLRQGRAFALWILWASLVLIAIIVIMRGGVQHFSLSIGDVYDYRSTSNELVFFGGAAYLKFWVARVSIPFLLALAIWRRKWPSTVLLLIAAVLFFGVTAHKAFLLYPALVVASYVLCRLRRPMHWLVGGLALAVLGSLVLSALGYSRVADLLIRRSLFTTAKNHYLYYDFFRANGYLLFSSSVLKNTIAYPYEYQIPVLMSVVRYGHALGNVNAGFLATGYMNYGYLGMLLYTAILAPLLNLGDSMVRPGGLPVSVVAAMVIASYWSLTSADLMTALVTHGILLAMVILWLLSYGKPRSCGIED